MLAHDWSSVNHGCMKPPSFLLAAGLTLAAFPAGASRVHKTSWGSWWRSCPDGCQDCPIGSNLKGRGTVGDEACPTDPHAPQAASWFLETEGSISTRLESIAISILRFDA